MTPILQINNFSLQIEQNEQWRPILNQVSFALNRGEIIGIVGESGSGKSVTALSVMRLLNEKKIKNSGEILFNSQEAAPSTNLLKVSHQELRKIRGKEIAMIFQEPMTSLNPVIRCGEQIAENILIHTSISKKEAKDIVLKLLEEVLLPRPEKIYASYPHELSGGQKQRVMIAMAMSCNPQILIADEPTTALDVTVQKKILALIKELQQKYGMSVIFISHDLGVIAEIATRVLVMKKGEIVEVGTVEQILNHPQHPYTQGLIACRPPLDVRYRRLPTVEDYLSQKHVAPTIISTAERAENHQQLYASQPLIRIEHLTKTYPLRKERWFEKRGYLHALQDINLEVFEGETLGLVGESGCGKTTLGRTLLRLIEPTAGKVFYKDGELTQLSGAEMRRMRKEMQIILQDPYSSLNQRMSIGAAIMEPMQYHKLYGSNKERKMRAIELLQRVGLEESHFYRYPHEFSGGQRQRIGIARALAVNPKFIICDESVSALDVSVQAQVLNLLNEIKREFHLTYIFISHDLSVVKFMSDRMAVMQAGHIVELDDADKVYDHPQTEYTQQLIHSIPKI
ncbi:MAG: ABC transporter ATP-binding protein [Bacteroidales bacterium]|jgi:peptide/nickel transport system ATP-binding protein|nr:ABC transporter ATP-binding protein [Bacteroidales bacterium]